MGFFEDDGNENLKMNFRIEDEIAINPVEFQIFNSEFCGNRVLCQVDRVNGVRVLNYTIPASISLSQFLRKKLYASEFISLFSNILRQIIFLSEKNMPVKKLLLNSKYINVDLTNMSVQLIYMPIEKNFGECDVKEFMQELLQHICCADGQCQDYLSKVSGYVNSDAKLDVKNLYKFVLELGQFDTIEEKSQDVKLETTVLAVNKAVDKKINPFLVRIKTNELISINKPYFNVGKGSDSDYQIMDNKKISRKHCTLRFSNGQCFIRDNGSTNNTYVNNMSLEPNIEILLNNDDFIKMADEEFKYWER